jgi:hypothetical protein
MCSLVLLFRRLLASLTSTTSVAGPRKGHVVKGPSRQGWKLSSKNSRF